jgi:hypothetical protein
MESPVHSMESLFDQLGLPSDADAIARFIARNAPIPHAVPLAEAPIWTPVQAQFLNEKILEDADWAEVIDTLNAELHAGGPAEREERA